MSYPEFIQGDTRCAHCKSVLEDEYLTVRDNYLTIHYFDFENGEDNIFCDEHCLAKALSAEKITIEDEDEDEC